MNVSITKQTIQKNKKANKTQKNKKANKTQKKTKKRTKPKKIFIKCSDNFSL